MNIFCCDDGDYSKAGRARHDSNFTWKHFQAGVNHDLADLLGNFVNRIAKFCAARFAGLVPGKGEYGTVETETTVALEEKLTILTSHMQAMEFRKSATALRSIWVIGMNVPEVLFAKIEDTQVADWAERFGGAGNKNGRVATGL